MDDFSSHSLIFFYIYTLLPASDRRIPVCSGIKTGTASIINCTFVANTAVQRGDFLPRQVVVLSFSFSP